MGIPWAFVNICQPRRWGEWRRWGESRKQDGWHPDPQDHVHEEDRSDEPLSGRPASGRNISPGCHMSSTLARFLSGRSLERYPARVPRARRVPGSHCDLRGSWAGAGNHPRDAALGRRLFPIVAAAALPGAGGGSRGDHAGPRETAGPRTRWLPGERPVWLDRGVADPAPRPARHPTARGISPGAGRAPGFRAGVHRLESRDPNVQPLLLGPAARRVGRDTARRNPALGDPPAAARQASGDSPARRGLPDVASGAHRRGGLAGLEPRSGRPNAVLPGVRPRLDPAWNGAGHGPLVRRALLLRPGHRRAGSLCRTLRLPALGGPPGATGESPGAGMALGQLPVRGGECQHLRDAEHARGAAPALRAGGPPKARARVRLRRVRGAHSGGLGSPGLALRARRVREYPGRSGALVDGGYPRRVGASSEAHPGDFRPVP